MHSRNLLRSLRVSLLILLVIAGCRGMRRGIPFNPMPTTSGQWVEYVSDSVPYEEYHVRFAVLDINASGIKLETDYITPAETLKIVSFNNIESNYSIDTFIVQYNSEKPYKFIPPGGHFIFDSPIPNLFIWEHQIDTTDWETIILNKRQYNVFKVARQSDTVYYSDEIPLFNVASMRIGGRKLNVYNYGSKGGSSLIKGESEELVTGSKLPDIIRRSLEP